MLDFFCHRCYREGKKRAWIGKAFVQAIQSGKWDFSNSIICNATLPPNTTIKANFVGTTFVNVNFQNATFEIIHLCKTIFIDVKGLVIKEGTLGDWMIYNSCQPENKNRKVLNGKGFLSAVKNRHWNFNDHIICNATFPEGEKIDDISLHGAILINVNFENAELVDVGIYRTICIEARGLSLERIKLTTVDVKDDPTGEIYHMQKLLGPPITLR